MQILNPGSENFERDLMVKYILLKDFFLLEFSFLRGISFLLPILIQLTL